MIQALLLLVILAAVGCGSGVSTTTTTSTTAFRATLLPVREQIGTYYGYVDTAGNWAIEPRFQAAWQFIEGLAPVKLDGKWGYIDETGSIVIEPQFTEAYYFREGIARVATGPPPEPGSRYPTASGYGFIDMTGRFVIPAEWDAADDFHDGLAAVMLDAACGFIDKNGELVIRLEFDVVGPFSEGLAQAHVDGRYGYIDTKGEWVIDPQYESGMVAEGVLLAGTGLELTFSSGLAPVYTEGTLFGGGGTCQYIDRKGKKAFPQVFQYGGVFNEGLAPVCVDGKWGFIDTSGKLVIEPRYDLPPGRGPEFYLLPSNGFHNGLAPIALDHRVGYVDHSGALVVAPQYFGGSAFFGGFAYVESEEPRVFSGVIDLTGSWVYRISPVSEGEATTVH